MTRDDYIKLHQQTVEAIDLVDKHGIEKCVVEMTENMHGDYWTRCDWMPDFDARFYRARIKAQSKLVPWASLNEVPLMHWFRRGCGGDILKLKTVKPEYKSAPVMIGSHFPTFSELLRDYEHAEPRNDYRDLVWLPCGTEVVE